MRLRWISTIALLCLLVSPSCMTISPPPAPPAAPAAAVPPVHGLTIAEEATILRLEDRRQFDPQISASWLANPNPLHRARMALALARIGPHAFVDANGNGERDPDENAAGVTLLRNLTGDPSVDVRRNVAFALGEIGDPAGIEALFVLARDPEHADVAAEAVEALSKMASNVPLDRFLELTRPPTREGVRARALRFLFRFDRDEAAAAAAAALDDPDPAIRREAAYALSRRALATAEPKLRLLVGDGDTLVRSYAVRALGLTASSEDVWNAMIGALADPHPWVRTNAARGLVQIAGRSPSLLDRPDAANDLRLVLAATSDPDPGTRAVSIDTLALYATRSASARARLLELAAEGSRWQREIAAAAATRALGQGEPALVDSLLKSDDPWLTKMILDAAVELSIGSELRARLAESSDVLAREAAIGSIPDSHVDAEIELVRKGLQDADVIVRANAIDRYAHQSVDPPDAMIDTLRQAESRAVSDAMNDARLAAIQALAGIDFPGREPFLRERVDDSDPVVRRVSAGLIRDRLGKNLPSYTPLPVERPLSTYEAIAEWAAQPHTATIVMPRGNIELVLLPQDAPMTAKNFADLAAKGYFDETTFMRVVPNFVIQGGDPRNDQNGGPGYAIRDEINLQKYTRGAVGMALSGPDTGGSQDFVAHSPQPHLDGGYTIFARVVGGMSGVVDQVERGDRVTTIRIDEATVPAQDAVAAVEKTPLPTEIGTITPERLLSIIPEYGERRNAYQPDPAVIQFLAQSIQPGDSIEVVLGTWCTDSLREVPKFLKILDELRDGFGVEIPVSWIAVNRAKNEPAELLEGKGIEEVSTFIYLRDGEEIGRIVERPTGLLEDDLLNLAVGAR